jgi:DNA-binding transcriptional LysR family regulator
LRLRQLADTPFVLFPRAHNPGFYDRILAAFSSAGITPRIAEEIWPRANGIGLVRAGLAPPSSRPRRRSISHPRLRFRSLSGPAPESRLVLGWRHTTTQEPALAAFLSRAGTLE